MASTSSMTITFQDGRGTYTLKGARMAPPRHIHATVTDVLQSNNDMDVCRAETSEGPRMMKVASSEVEMDAIEREARVYDELVRDLMGSDVLTIYGSYRGENQEGQRVMCIVSEHFSELVEAEGSIPNLPMHKRHEFLRYATPLYAYLTDLCRREIAERLGRLHLAGVLPVFDLGGGNVVRFNDGSLRIGHFQDLQRHDPPCAWDGNWRFDEAQPDPEDFRCDALYEAGKEMGIWRSHIMDLSSMIVSQTTVVEEQQLE